MKHNVQGDMGATHVIGFLAISDTAAHQIAVDDMTNSDGVGYVLQTTGTLAGAWTFQGINGYRSVPGLNNSQASPGVSGDISSLASPAPGAILTGGSSKATQISPFMWGACGITFTATSGSGTATVTRVKKGNS